MYYLRKEPYEETIPEIRMTDGEVIPERKYMVEDRAIYKNHDFSRFYRCLFFGLDKKHQGMKVYTCKTLKKILALRDDMHEYCGEWFDVYDENGKVNLPEKE
ncbi:hypothetical protein SDC9_173220 [bioreactor metagenome]|uniref:Uncharacterized protein n=1 Tax=bioreactor metagenome TaxID=1076179 RepID=A0A645GPC9_9ZZZZ